MVVSTVRGATQESGLANPVPRQVDSVAVGKGPYTYTRRTVLFAAGLMLAAAELGGMFVAPDRRRYPPQSSQSSPSMRANSETFAVTSVASSRIACAAMSRS